MSRIYMNAYDDWGCGYYRAKLPVYQCYSDLSKQGVHLHIDKELHMDELFYDVYILHRMPLENFIFFMQNIQKKGGKFVLEMDDDIFNIPEWMPSEEYKSSKWALKTAIDMADEIWVSTEPLAETLGLPEKTQVLPNLVDYNAFLKPVAPLGTQPLRILWMGSMWHDKDLEQLVPATLRIVEEYGDQVQFLFWGCLPTALADYHRVPGQNFAVLTQKDYNNRILFLEGLPFKFYFDRLVKISPYIGLAPLYDCQFNDSKSNLKFLEYTMAGAATIATDLSPYKCIQNGVDGLLVEPHDEDGWYRAIKTLIDNRDLRDSLVKNARETVYKYHSWQSQNKKKMWLDAFRNIAGLHESRKT